MGKDKRSNVGIWKLRDISSKKNKRAIIEQIIKNQNDSNRDTDGRVKNRLAEIKGIISEYDGYSIALFHRKRDNDGIYSFISGNIDDNISGSQKRAIEQKLTYETVDALLFIYNNKSIYVVTTASGHFIIKDYVDDDFPLEIASRIMSGSFHSSGSRAISGPVHSETRMYRKAYSVSESEAFGKVWKSLKGGVMLDDDLKENVPLLNEYLKVNKDMQAEIKLSFTLNKTLDLQQLLQLIDELNVVSKEPLSDERKKTFAFLETTKPVKAKPIINALDEKLLKIILSDTKKGSTTNDFDICHPDEPEKYMSGYLFSYNILGDVCKYGSSIDKPNPSYPNLIKDLHESGKYKAMDISKFAASFSRYKLHCVFDEEEESLITTLFRCIHGEVEHDGIVYFRIDGRWYEAPGQFLEKLDEYFKKDIQNGLVETGINFIDYPAKKKISKGKRDDREGRFNTDQAKDRNFYYGDKIFAKFGRADIELFDLLYVTDSQLFIIQTKDGFSGSMRDAISQITMSARFFEDTDTGKTLKEYYTKWVEAQPPEKKLSEKEFLTLFDDSRQRVYVVACAHKHDFTLANLTDKTKFYSHIAKFETCQAAKDFRGSGHTLKLARIAKT